ncbi:hypothetical protein [Clostridium grantii]|uniref:Nucleotidyltransferase substrate binding protein, HI0074 family n=1 Tax=Clostridium grantii DSM 8605 TaxID=1121316 RepID=A0A1M5W2G1_9CLOT|nr:hypothetical protein [Clostridium grantii]SHH81620.1 hypothetical protein SAMN02745207_02640 [Clostridium grantii DSM 8605]
MNSLNNERLKYISISMQDVIKDLDEIISIYDSQPIVIQKHLEQSFRTSFLQYKELLGNYMSQCLKILAISVNKITYADAIELCIKEEFLPKNEIVLYKTLSKFRNDTAHVYKKPPFKVLIEFYKEHRDFLINIIKTINSVIKKG